MILLNKDYYVSLRPPRFMIIYKWTYLVSTSGLIKLHANDIVRLLQKLTFLNCTTTIKQKQNKQKTFKR